MKKKTKRQKFNKRQIKAKILKKLYEEEPMCRICYVELRKLNFYNSSYWPYADLIGDINNRSTLKLVHSKCKKALKR